MHLILTLIAIMTADEISGDVVLARGPAMVLQAYQLIMTDDLHGNLEIGIVPSSSTDYLFNPLGRIWEERKTKPSDSSTHWASLLDDIRGGNDTCKLFHLSLLCIFIPSHR